MKNKNLIHIIILLTVTAFLIISCQPNTLDEKRWIKSYGGDASDIAYAIAESPDGYLVAGKTESFGGGNSDLWVINTDKVGNVIWEKSIGGTYYEWVEDAIYVPNEGYIILAITVSFGAGKNDFWLLKMNEDGDILWQKTYGGPEVEQPAKVIATDDGGYAVVGTTNSFSDDGNDDMWLIKLDNLGDVEWQKTYGGIDTENAYSLDETSDGGYVIGGDTFSFGAGSFDYMIVKLNETGNVEWAKTYGGDNGDTAYDLSASYTGEYILAGKTQSFESTSLDSWVCKLRSDGNIEWSKVYGGDSGDMIYSVVNEIDSFIIAGYSYSFSTNYSDSWVVKLNGDGNILWQKIYSTPDYDSIYEIIPTLDGGYISTGYLEVDKEGAKVNDFLVIKTDEMGLSNSMIEQNISISPINVTAETYDISITPVTSSIQVNEISSVIIMETDATVQSID